MSEIVEAIQRFDVVPGAALTVDQIKAMTLAVKAGQLKVDQMKQIADITKSFNHVALEAAKSFAQIAESAGTVKQSAIIALNEIVSSLEKIATSTDDVGVKGKVIDCLMKIADKIEKADDRNHSFFWGLALLVGSVAISVAARRPVRLA